VNTTSGGPWWRQIPWIAIGTVLTVVAGIGTLGFTGVATYYDARVAADALDQSREDAADKERSQAVLVSAWVEGSSLSSMSLHVINRSPDPVSFVSIRVSISYRSKGVRYDYLSWSETSLPPCTERVYRGRQLATPQVGEVGPALQLGSILFVDRHGDGWERTWDSLRRLPEPFQGFDNSQFETYDRRYLTETPRYEEKPVARCADLGS
jgi:hypothetical protein